MEFPAHINSSFLLHCAGISDLVNGAVVGIIVAELLKAILEGEETAMNFRDCFHRLQKTVETLQVTVLEVKRLDEELRDTKLDDKSTVQRRENMTELLDCLEQGKHLINKCSKLPTWKIWKRHMYAKKLMKLDAQLLKFASMNMQAEIWGDTKQMMADAKRLYEELNSLSLKSTSRSGKFAYSNSVPQLPSKIVGLSVPVEELKRKLLFDNVSVIGVCAPGGCGKTTLVAKLCRDDKVRAVFGDIVFITVSETPNLLEICQRLWGKLVNASCVPHFINEDDAIDQLTDSISKRKQNPALVVLDDVWSESVLQRLLFRKTGLKTLVTSRINFKGLDVVYPLQMLGQENAMDLFCQSAFAPDQAVDKLDHELLEQMEQIVKGCKGLPLALKVIGGSLRQEPVRKWRKTAQMLQQGNQIFEMHDDLLRCLSSSLNSLSKIITECFMDLGTFPEDEKIPAASLIDMWVEIHGLTEDDAYVVLLELASRNLVTLVERTRSEAGNVDGSFSDLFVFQHDLLRELAIYTSRVNNCRQSTRLILSEGDLPKISQQQKEQASLAKIVSFNTGQMGTESWFDIPFPHAEVLILNFSADSYFLPPFLEKMENLKVLICANHGARPAELHGLSALGSLKNLHRIRLEKISVPPLSTFTQEMQTVQKLVMVLCEVSQVIHWDIHSIFPMLTELELDYCYGVETLHPGLCSLTNLQKLSITNCPDLVELPEGIGGLGRLEVLRLHSCSSLEGLPDSSCELGSLRFLDLSHCSSIESLPDNIGQLQRLKRIDMRWCLGLREVPTSVTQLNGLRAVECDEDTAYLWRPFEHVLSKVTFHIPKEDVSLKFLV
ncbi:putative disease resistance protein [Nymphaea thermarum]|nr:putative disease resistance protein [Nymphaea thermarum]